MARDNDKHTQRREDAKRWIFHICVSMTLSMTPSHMDKLIGNWWKGLKYPNVEYSLKKR